MKQENSEIGKKVLTDGLDLCCIITVRMPSQPTLDYTLLLTAMQYVHTMYASKYLYSIIYHPPINEFQASRVLNI